MARKRTVRAIPDHSLEPPMSLRHLVLALIPLAAMPLQASAERGLQPRDLAGMTRVSTPKLSTDGSIVV
jgi:hypothetical protein